MGVAGSGTQPLVDGCNAPTVDPSDRSVGLGQQAFSAVSVKGVDGQIGSLGKLADGEEVRGHQSNVHSALPRRLFVTVTMLG